MLADDNRVNQIVGSQVLKNLGYSVTIASNGLEASEEACVRRFDIIFMDLQMPRMDGIQALETLRELGCNHPIYALTANAMSHEIAQYLALGFAGHLKKPIEREAFFTTIAQHFVEIGYSAVNDVETHNILERTGENLDVSDLAASFIHNLSQDKADILRYSNNHEYEHLSRISHKISGAAQMFGFVELSQSAAELEQAIKKQNTNY